MHCYCTSDYTCAFCAPSPAPRSNVEELATAKRHIERLESEVARLTTKKKELEALVESAQGDAQVALDQRDRAMGAAENLAAQLIATAVRG